MKKLSLTLALIVVAALNAILLWGTGTAGGSAGHDALFGVLVLAMDVSLVVSSLLLGYLFSREHRTVWAALFFLNLLIMVAAFILKVSGIALDSFILFGADLYWLNLYLACVSCNWRWFRGPPGTSVNPGGVAGARLTA